MFLQGLKVKGQLSWVVRGIGVDFLSCVSIGTPKAKGEHKREREIDRERERDRGDAQWWAKEFPLHLAYWFASPIEEAGADLPRVVRGMGKRYC